MKKILLLFIAILFTAACTNGDTPKNVEDLDVFHPRNFYELATMFEDLSYEYEGVYSTEKFVVNYTFGGEDTIGGEDVLILNLDLTGDEAVVYVNSEGEIVKVILDGNEHTNDDDFFWAITREVTSKTPRILNSPNETITKRDRENDTLISTESITIGDYSGTKEIYEDERVSDLTGEESRIKKNLGIFDDFMMIIFDDVQRGDHYYVFEITSFTTR